MKVRVRRVSAEVVPVGITTDFIKLESFLKLANAVGSGGMAKNFIQNGEVDVNDAPSFEEIIKRVETKIGILAVSRPSR